MKACFMVFCFASLFSSSVFSRIPPGDDATTKPDLYYLKNEQTIDSLASLPPPP